MQTIYTPIFLKSAFKVNIPHASALDEPGCLSVPLFFILKQILLKYPLLFPIHLMVQLFRQHPWTLLSETLDS